MATERDSRAISDILNFLSNVFILEQLRREITKIHNDFNKVAPISHLIFLAQKVIGNTFNETN